METYKRVNKLKGDALTVDTVNPDDRIIVWEPDDEDSVRKYTVCGTSFRDEDETMVIEVRSPDGQTQILPTSKVGLTCDRHSGLWTHIAILDDTE
jgi:hypothetical protein